MDNPEYIFQILEVFSKAKSREIPVELEEYITYVARTGDPVFQWSLIKVLMKEKIIVVLDEFNEGNPNISIPPCPNTEQFNFEIMKSTLLERLESFRMPPFTIQRLCELLAAPKKEYSRIDKYMRALEKNILVVSTSDLGLKSGSDADSNDAINGMFEENDAHNISNHMFCDEEQLEQDNESICDKLEPSDAVQQIIEESWNSGNQVDEFKVTSATSTTLNDYELDFEKKNEEEDINQDESIPQEGSSFGSDSMIMDTSLQNMIDSDDVNISFENTSKSEENDEKVDVVEQSKANDTYEFKDDSISDISMPDSMHSFEIKATTTGEAETNDSINLDLPETLGETEPVEEVPSTSLNTESEQDNVQSSEESMEESNSVDVVAKDNNNVEADLNSEVVLPADTNNVEQVSGNHTSELDSNLSSTAETAETEKTLSENEEIILPAKNLETVESTTNDDNILECTASEGECISENNIDESEILDADNETKIEEKALSCGDSELPSSSDSESLIKESHVDV